MDSCPHTPWWADPAPRATLTSHLCRSGGLAILDRHGVSGRRAVCLPLWARAAGGGFGSGRILGAQRLDSSPRLLMVPSSSRSVHRVRTLAGVAERTP